ncbi:MAG TPA: hypothetical protein VFZ09_26375 [Archangium sp.]|uniref:hypothetical protein n=1 Tax=Archangium sp. TaxID=1872627 RepID=UPI002E35E570|nr:hypothetical protein [Archangium sp.]HEX5749784.1 hypothetical protein [Archangium sp.]
MRTPRWGFMAALLTGLLLGPAAGAREPTVHRITVYVHSGMSLYLSEARTLGGVGGGLGVRDTLDERFILQADASYLMALGKVVEVRAGAGLQRSGTWTPAALVMLSCMAGQGMRFLTPTRSTPVEGPALTVGLQLAPLRFTHSGTQLSLFELGVGVGSDWPGRGLTWHLTLLQAGTTF